jgi:hypothetical protein
VFDIKIRVFGRPSQRWWNSSNRGGHSGTIIKSSKPRRGMTTPLRVETPARSCPTAPTSHATREMPASAGSTPADSAAIATANFAVSMIFAYLHDPLGIKHHHLKRVSHTLTPIQKASMLEVLSGPEASPFHFLFTGDEPWMLHSDHFLNSRIFGSPICLAQQYSWPTIASNIGHSLARKNG